MYTYIYRQTNRARPVPGGGQKGIHMLLVKNVRLINPGLGQDMVTDILMGDGAFLKIAPDLEAPGGAFVIDGKGLTAAPGLIDTHSHFRDPGFTYKEDLNTGAAAAAKGGYTSVILMANVVPPVDRPEVLSDILERGKKTPVHIYSCANVTKAMAGKELGDLKALADAGAAGFTDDGKPILDPEILRAALRIAGPLGLPVSLHEEDPGYIKENGINGHGEAAAALCLTGSDRKAEYTMVERDLQIAIEEKAPLCIQHISTKEAVDLVRKARALCPLVHAEATPHHFSLTEKAVIEKGTLARVNPPLRTEEDRMAIIRGIQDGTIDIIATDHAPHADFEKAKEFTKAPSGMIGLETALSLGIRELVKPGYISMNKLIALLTCNPASFYHLSAGTVREGAPADLVLFDPEETWTVTDSFASKSSNSPFIGETLPGVVKYTIASGQIVYRG